MQAGGAVTQSRGIYLISVVAKTLDMHPQTLRKYERAGFIEPLRMGSLRTYSDEDVARLRLIKHFVEDMGLNLAGVELALHLTSELLEVRKGLSGGRVSAQVAESIKRVDGMLAALGVRVVSRPKREEQQTISQPGDGWFKVNPGEALEFQSGPRRVSFTVE